MPGRPLDLCPANPRFLRFRGEPTFLLTAAEHYGAVLNLDFDHHRYLAELQKHRFNYTRVFSGTFVEPEDTLAGLAWENTLAPRPGRFVGPWARSDTEGYEQGGPRFDLTQWNEAYWDRLRDFVHQAGLRGIIVEYTLFCVMYQPTAWSLSPMKASNNVNGVGDIGHRDVYTIDNDGLWEHQERFARRAAQELAGFDNVFVELVNEPYFGENDDRWIDGMVDVLQEEFATAGRSLLLAWNLANFHERADKLNPAFSIVNFHYANPPTAVALNHDLEKVVVYDESGFAGRDDEAYRRHAWQFMLAGGSGFNHLDWSFAPSGAEDGSLVLPAAFPSGGSAALRSQLTVLRDFLAGLPFATMTPDTSFVVTELAESAQVHGLAEAGEAYALHLVEAPVASLQLSVAAGYYRQEWSDPMTGRVLAPSELVATTGTLHVAVPPQHRELALSLRRHRLPGEGDAASSAAGGRLFDFAGVAQNS